MLLAHATIVGILEPGDRHWEILRGLTRDGDFTRSAAGLTPRRPRCRPRDVARPLRPPSQAVVRPLSPDLPDRSFFLVVIAGEIAEVLRRHGRLEQAEVVERSAGVDDFRQ